MFETLYNHEPCPYICFSFALTAATGRGGSLLLPDIGECDALPLAAPDVVVFRALAPGDRPAVGVLAAAT
jgi:hypothetical protein